MDIFKENLLKGNHAESKWDDYEPKWLREAMRE